MSNTKNILFMKKILLFVATAMFAISGAAQNMQLSKTATITPPSGENTLKFVGGLKHAKPLNAGERLRKSAPMAAQAKAAPAGEARDYFFYRAENVYGIGDLERINKVTLYFDGNTVYIPNDFYLSQLNEAEPAYITGTVSADGTTITIPSHQEIGTITSQYGDMTLYFSKGEVATIAEGNTLVESSDPIVYNVDPTLGVIFDNTTQQQADYVGLFTDSGYYGYAYNVLIFPSSLFNMSQRTLTGTGIEPDNVLQEYVDVNVNKTVEEYYYPDMGIHAIKGLFNFYPDSYVIAFDNQDGSISVGAQAIADDVPMVAIGDINSSQISFAFESTFEADATGAYTQKSGEYIVEGSIEGQTFYIGARYTGLKLGVPTSSGISSAVADDAKEAVSTQYFDLSGRRVSGAEKGVSIKVMKYADGTSKAVKVMK